MKEPVLLANLRRYPHYSVSKAMAVPVTAGAQGNKIGFVIISQRTSWLYVVYLKTRQYSAHLAAPAVAF